MRKRLSVEALGDASGLQGPVELALRFGLSKPGVSTVLVGYSTLAHLEDALRFTQRGALPADVIEQVLATTVPAQ